LSILNAAIRHCSKKRGYFGSATDTSITTAMEHTMATKLQRITPFLWFDDQAEEAANFYISIFPNSQILSVHRYGGVGATASGRREGSVMVVAFRLDGQDFTALNGGPRFQFNIAVSLVVNCESQSEIDYYWEKLAEGGDERAQQCGWLKDKYGLSWQVVPAELPQLLADSIKGDEVMRVAMQMKKFDLAAMHAAAR
jgi:predicted 3-demethylubiquinone-9 3-methyltransferase (glyoxalase superfamily)